MPAKLPSVYSECTEDHYSLESGISTCMATFGADIQKQLAVNVT